MHHHCERKLEDKNQPTCIQMQSFKMLTIIEDLQLHMLHPELHNYGHLKTVVGWGRKEVDPRHEIIRSYYSHTCPVGNTYV